MKKILALILVCALTFALAACGAPAPESSEPAAEPESTAEPSAEPEPEAAAGLKIAIVTSPSGVDDGSFNEDCYNGILAFIEEHPEATVTHVQESDIANSVQAVADIVADYDVIVTPGFQFAPIATIAQENPEKFFILVDSYPSDAEGKEVAVDNIYAMQFAEQESGFLAGISAAMKTETGKVAVVNGIAYPSNVNYQYGFMAGVNYANKFLGTAAECVEIAAYAGTDVTGANVGGNYVGDFNDAETGKVVGAAIIGEGCDVIFVAAGNSGNGVFTAAKETEGVMVIGCDVDQFDDGVNGDTNIVLTSVLKNMAAKVNEQLVAITDGAFAGGNYLLQANVDGTGYVSAEGRQQLSEETIAACDEAYAKLKDGTIVPPSNFGGTTPTDFVGIEG